MITRGIKIAAEGMKALIDLNDVTANNIANVNTSGFKKANLTFRDLYNAAVDRIQVDSNPDNYSYRQLGTISMGSQVDELLNEFSQGTLERTSNPLDLAIEGDGFFKLRSPITGQISYTRNGAFAIDTKNFLVTENGDYVLDRLSRPIKLDLNQGDLKTRNNIAITEEGIIELNKEGNKEVLQQIGIFDFQNKEDLKSLGAARFIPQHPDQNPEMISEKYVIQQGAIEASNSNIVKEMVNMINVSRSYETLSKFVKNQSDGLSRAINLARINS